MHWLPALNAILLAFPLTSSGSTNHKPEVAKPQTAGTLAAVLTQQWLRWSGLDNSIDQKAVNAKIHHQMVPEKRLGSFDLPKSKPSRILDSHRQGMFYAGIVEGTDNDNFLPFSGPHSEFPPGLRENPNYFGPGTNYPPRPAYEPYHHHGMPVNSNYEPYQHQEMPGNPHSEPYHHHNMPGNPHSEPYHHHDMPGNPHSEPYHHHDMPGNPHSEPYHHHDMPGNSNFEPTQYSPVVAESSFGRPVVLDHPNWQSSSQFPKPIPPFSTPNNDMFKGFHDTTSPLMGSASMTSSSSAGSQSLWQVVDVATAMKPGVASSSFQHNQFYARPPPHFKSLNGHRVIDTLDPAFLAWALHRTKNGKKIQDNRQKIRRPVVVVVTGSNLPASVLADHPNLGGTIGGRNTNQNGQQVLLHVDLDQSTIKAITPQTLQHLGLTANARPATTIHLHRPPGFGLQNSLGGIGGLGHLTGLAPGFRNPNLPGNGFENSGLLPPLHSFIPSSLTAGSGSSKPNSPSFPFAGINNNLIHQSGFGNQFSSDVAHQNFQNPAFGINGFQDGPTPFTNQNNLGSLEPFSELIDDEDEEWSVFPLPSNNFHNTGSGISDNFQSSSLFSSTLSQLGIGNNAGGIFGGAFPRPLSTLGQLRPLESKRLRELLARILKPFAARYKLVIGPSGLEPTAFMDKRAEKRTGDQAHNHNITTPALTNNGTTTVTAVIANVTELSSNSRSDNVNSTTLNTTTLLGGDLRSIITPRR